MFVRALFCTVARASEIAAWTEVHPAIWRLGQIAAGANVCASDVPDMARLWDAFLTPQDKAASATRGDRRFGFGERPALLMIDLYRWVFGDRPQPLLEAMQDWPGTCGLAGW